MTIHITPEPEFSYVSFESNIPLTSYLGVIQRVLETFMPGKFILTIFANRVSSLSKQKEHDWSLMKSLKMLYGSPIWIWYKVKTWLDQMFWQIYQKMMLSGFLSSGNLCLIHYFKLFWPHAASTASDRKGAKI